MALQQPNFARASASLADTAQELALCANMPVVIQGQGIIDAINALGVQLQQMQQQITGLHGRFDSLTVEMRARDVNNHTRFTNNILTKKADQPLEPLCSITTGNPIPGFPLNSNDLMKLTPNEANDILRHLGHDMGQAPVAVKRQRIKSLCGLVAF